MTKDEVKRVFKSGNGKDIAKAVSEYYHEQFAIGKIKPLEFYKPGDLQKEIKSDKRDVVDIANEVFSY